MRFLIKLLVLFLVIIFSMQGSYASVWSDFTLPLEKESSQKVLIYGGATVLMTTFLKNSLSRRIQRDLKEDQPLCCKITKPGNAYLQILPNLLYSIGFGLDYYFSQNDLSKERAIGMAKATIYSGLVTDILKPLVHEKRPNGANFNSFPSGHTTTAFAFASFIASEHPWYIGVPAYTMASFVGFCRMHDAHHYLHDVLAGATIGMSYGLAFAQNIKRDNTSQAAFLLVPTDELKGLALKVHFDF